MIEEYSPPQIWCLTVQMAHRVFEYHYSNEHDARQGARGFQRYPGYYRVEIARLR